MRDGITLSRAGHPVVVFVHDNFERAARAQAAGLRLPDLRIYVYPQYKPGDPLSLEAGKAVRAVEEFPKLLMNGN
ncbi:MAG: hypothetical protein HYY79_02685 [Betaproteobacteria bacterium]|nr:hypothetical protein [Betaproteobacteria bacterium]